jgi:2-methylcitrate dehydratase PrpD
MKSGTPLTARMAEHVTSIFGGAALPGRIEAQAGRVMLNVIAAAVAGAAHPAVRRLSAVNPGGGAAGVPVLGLHRRADVATAALLTGTAAEAHHFSDVHRDTMLHPGAPALAAAMPMAAFQRSSGEDTVRAFALGVEVEVRLARALTRAHYENGWDPTGTCGVIGAAVTAGLLAGADRDRLVQGVGLAMSQMLGHRQSEGTDVRAFHAGKAASNGVLSVLLAEQGFTAPDAPLEHRRGFFSTLAPEAADTDGFLEAFGETWHLTEVVPQRFPCAVVSHPAIEAALRTAGEMGSERATEVVAACHPSVLRSAGRTHPTTLAEARYSTAHAVAVALTDRAVGLAQYTEERVSAPEVQELRSLVRVEADEVLQENEARVWVLLENGARVGGDLVRAGSDSDSDAMSDAALERKVRMLVEPVIGEASGELIGAVRDLPRSRDLTRVFAAATPAADDGGDRWE